MSLHLVPPTQDAVEKPLHCAEVYARAALLCKWDAAAGYCKTLAELCRGMSDPPQPSAIHSVLAATLPSGHPGQTLHREVFYAVAKARGDAPIASPRGALNYEAKGGAAIAYTDETNDPKSRLTVNHCVVWCQLLGFFVERGMQKQALQWTHELHILLQHLARPSVVVVSK
jgi:hypothetical protein